MKKQIKGSLCLLLCTTIWGFAFIAQSVGMDKIGPFTFQAVRCALAVLFLTGYEVYKYINNPENQDVENIQEVASC